MRACFAAVLVSALVREPAWACVAGLLKFRHRTLLLAGRCFLFLACIKQEL
jgi:hypothetical protein